MTHIAPKHHGRMDITQLALIVAAVIGVLVIGLAAIVPNLMELPG